MLAAQRSHRDRLPAMAGFALMALLMVFVPSAAAQTYAVTLTALTAASGQLTQETTGVNMGHNMVRDDATMSNKSL